MPSAATCKAQITNSLIVIFCSPLFYCFRSVFPLPENCSIPFRFSRQVIFSLFLHCLVFFCFLPFPVYCNDRTLFFCYYAIFSLDIVSLLCIAIILDFLTIFPYVPLTLPPDYAWSLFFHIRI
jgi:hypothetical protein